MLKGEVMTGRRVLLISAAAPVTELAALFDAEISTMGGETLAAMMLWSESQVFGARLDMVADPDVITSINAIANDCSELIAEVSSCASPSGPCLTLVQVNQRDRAIVHTRQVEQRVFSP